MVILWVIAVGLVVLGGLTVWRAPTYGTWKLAILAGEYGHGLSLGALALGAGAGWGMVQEVGGGRLGWGVVMGLAWVAAGLLARPTVLGWRKARRLPVALASGLGEPVGQAKGGGRVGKIWSWARLVKGTRVEPVAVQRRTYGHGGEGGGRVELEMDFYPAAVGGEGEAGAVCVVMIHGGGWDGGSPDQMVRWNHRLARRGVAVAAIAYRLAPRHPWPAQREDTLAAVAHLKAHAVELGIDAGRLILFGRSAGGQIATATGYAAGDGAIRAVVALYAPHDMGFVWSIAREDDVLNSVKLLRQYLGGPPTVDRLKLYQSASAQGMVKFGVTPMTLLVHGQLDELVWAKHSERLAERLKEVGVPHYFLNLPWATHACDFNEDGPSGQLIEAAVGAVVDRVKEGARGGGR